MAGGGRRDSFLPGCFLLLSDHPGCSDSLWQQSGDPLCNFPTLSESGSLSSLEDPSATRAVPVLRGGGVGLGLSSAGPTCIQTDV